MSESSQTEDPPFEETGSSQLWSWIFLSVILVTAVTLAAVHMPARIKLLGLYSILFGLIVGEILARLATAFRISSGRRIRLAVFVFLLSSQVGLAVESSRMYSRSMQQAANDPAQILFQRVLTETEATGFKAYLQHRVSPLGNMDEPWPIVFWIFETLIGSIAGVCWFRHNHQATPQNLLHKTVSEIDGPSPVE